VAVLQAKGPTISDSLVSGNRADWGGGLLVVGNSDVVATGCAFVANFANTPVGGGAVISDSRAALVGSIFWGNTGGETLEAAQIQTDESATATVNYSCVEGWTGALGGVGNIGNDPLFVDPLGPDGLAGTSDDDLHLSSDSPLINAGDPNVPSVTGATDLDGRPRVLCDRIDMGPYEFGMGDYDCDRDVDLEDVAAFQRCFASVVQTEGTSACGVFDFAPPDRDIDLDDYLALWSAWTDPRHPETMCLDVEQGKASDDILPRGKQRLPVR
jgi:hypothetical protein